MNPWLEFFGRLHPLILHLPIGIFFLAFLLELRGRFRGDAAWAAAARYALGWSAFTAVLACVSGWLLGADYHNALLERHRWLGIATAVSMTMVWLTRVQAIAPFFRFLASGLTIAVLGVAAHHGGSMTHGEDFLTGALPPPFRRAAVAGAEVPVPDTIYAAYVHPSLEASCVKCHGPEKSKGSVRMDTLERLLASKDHSVVTPGQPGTSKLLKVAQLPRDDDDAMPPKGKGDPLTPDQLAVITWWIEQGAKPDQPLSALPAELKAQGDAVLALLARHKPAPAAAAPAAPALPAANPQVVAALSADGLLVQPLSQQDVLLSVETVNLGTNFNGAWLQRLQPLAPQVAWLDASRSGLSAGSLGVLTRFSNLARLRLNGTAVGDADLLPLRVLKHLEYLNLTSTPVTDGAVDTLAAIRPLKRVFVWDSAVTTQGVARLRAARPDLEVDDGAAPFAAATPTEAPAAPGEGQTAKDGDQPINTVCPVKGTEADPSITFVYEGRKIAFCCTKCCAAFQKDPKAYLAKLPQ